MKMHENPQKPCIVDRQRRSVFVITFNCVSETFRGGGVVGRCVKSVNLQTFGHVLGLRETLDHRPVDVSCRVPSDGRRLSVWRERNRDHVSLFAF